MTDNLITGSEARGKLMAGVRKVSEAIGATLGTAGSNSLIECIESPGHYPTNDGATILGSIKLADPLEEIGRKILNEAVSRANKSSGDGSSTTCVLTAAIFEEGQKYLNESSPMEIKKSLEECLPLIESSLQVQKKEITVDNVSDVATISSEDTGIGQMIQEIYQKIGKDGVIQWDISKTPKDSYSIGTGITINDATYVSSYMCDQGTREVRLMNPKVLLCKNKITSAIEFEKLFSDMAKNGEKGVLIFCEEMEIPVIIDLLQTQRVQGFRSVVVRMPVLWRDEWWEDLSLASGGKVIDSAAGLRLNQVTSAVLGQFEHVTISSGETIIEGTQDISKHLLALKVENTDESLVRAARLNTQTARYFVGAQSESALAYRRLKVEDAIWASSCALDGGVVPGGGVALFSATQTLPKDTIGGKILAEALKVPLRWIVKNAGGDIDKIEPRIVSGRGFNSRTGEVVDMIAEGIVDPTDVEINAIKNAIGVAADILTIRNVITLPKDAVQTLWDLQEKEFPDQEEEDCHPYRRCRFK